MVRKYGRCPSEQWRGRRKTFRDDGDEAIEQQIGWTGRARRPRSQFGSTGYVEQAAGGGEATGAKRSAPRVEVALARKLGIEPLKPLGCVQEQWRRCASHARRERDLAAEPLRLRLLQIVWRRGLRQRQKLEPTLKDPGMQARLHSGKRTPHPLLGIARQTDRARQERGGRAQAAARLRAVGGLLERRGDRLIGPRCGCGQMPRAE